MSSLYEFVSLHTLSVRVLLVFSLSVDLLFRWTLLILVFVLSDLSVPGSQRRFVGLQWCFEEFEGGVLVVANLALDKFFEGFDRKGLGPGDLS